MNTELKPDIMPVKRPEGVANLVTEAAPIKTFPIPKPVHYYDNEKIVIRKDTWCYSGTFTYSELNDWTGLAVIFAKATYSNADISPVVGTRDLAVSVRNTGEGKTEALVWIDAERENQLCIMHVSTSAEKLETGVAYTYTIQVKEGKLTFWLDNTLILNGFDLNGFVSDLKPNFGYVAIGPKGTIANVEIWDGSKVVTPVFADSDKNRTILEEIEVTEQTGTLLFAGITYGNVWNYSATVTSLDDVTLLLGMIGDEVVTIQSLLGQTSVPTASTYRCLARYEAGKVSVWINDILYVMNRELCELQSGAGIVASGKTTVSGIQLWGEVTDADRVLYQKMNDIAPYREKESYTYPVMNGYVFGGWYEKEDESLPVSNTVVSGSAYAKFVPEKVLSVQAQAGKNAKYDLKEQTKLRFITTVDSMIYEEVGFDVTMRSRKNELRSDNLYQTVDACDGDQVITYEPTKFHKEAKYFSVITYDDISYEEFDEPITVVPMWITKDGTTVKGVEREIAVNDRQNRRITQIQLGNGLGGSKVFQVGSGTKGDQNQMMSYLIEAYNPKDVNKPYVIMIDGGMVYEEYAGSDEEYLEWLLKGRYDGHVDAWFITHEHEDHYGSLLNMMRADKIGDGEGQITVDKLYYNFPDIKERISYTVEFLDIVPKKFSQEQIVDSIAKGTEYVFGRVKITILSDCREYYGDIYKNRASGDQNNASTLMMFQFYSDDSCDTLSEQILFLGDMGKKGEDKAFSVASKVASEKKIKLQDSVVQMAHHGNSGPSKAAYEWLKPKACLWPATNWLWNNMNRQTLIPRTGHWENMELCQFLVSIGCDKHYTAVDGNYEFH